MENVNLKERLKNVNSLNKDQQLDLRNQILAHQPQLLKRWWWFAPCEVNVLVVTDSSLNFGISGFGLSNFLTIFKKMEAESNTNLKYNVTLAHRGNPGNAAMQNSSPDFINKITNFKFDNTSHFTSNKYDQVWLFGFSSSSINNNEVNAIENYMNNGGGLFATGDHGSIGRGMCGNIPRVKDMRHWQDFGSGEVSMSGNRRNDTNTPHSGNYSSTSFNDQQDAYPQNIHARVYGAAPNLLPHYLLSINKNIKASGIIDIMPDHPHEGECKPETDFTVINPSTNNPHTIRTQNIAISFVSAGNTANSFGMKNPTDPHCFPSISVFDGRSAKVGRIVIDSTWHHFVNVNLDGFTTDTMDIVFQYYKNIARWMTRRKTMLCLYKRFTVHTMLSERIIEANTLDLDIKAEKIPNDELYAIGIHAMDIIENELTPADALEFSITMLKDVAPELSERLNIWHPKRDLEQDETHNQFFKLRPLSAMAIGMGIAKIKDKIGDPEKPLNEKHEAMIFDVFQEGAKLGLSRALDVLDRNISFMSKLKRFK
ncbi:hypothetical protein [uncultured Algibacter sp.]|uniref:hypothetical protein n=1 Tax=uncultured Algibacter sp. TaxID=298659 RepID=UPI0032178118